MTKKKAGKKAKSTKKNQDQKQNPIAVVQGNHRGRGKQNFNGKAGNYSSQPKSVAKMYWRK